MKASRPDPAGQELNGRGRPEDGRQPHQVDGPEDRTVDRAEARRSPPSRRPGWSRSGSNVSSNPIGGEGQADPGVAGHEAGEGEGQQLGAGQGDAHGPRPRLVVAHRHQPPGHPPVPPQPDHQHRHHQHAPARTRRRPGPMPARSRGSSGGPTRVDCGLGRPVHSRRAHQRHVQHGVASTAPMNHRPKARVLTAR